MSSKAVERKSFDGLALDFRELSVWSGSSWVLENISFEIPIGSFCVVLGGNGAGKSTLLAALSGVLEQPWRVALRGVPCDLLGHDAVRGSVSWLGQSLLISEDMSVREFLNLPVAFGLRPCGRSESWSIFGADELLDSRISTLSGGQWQRVRLARALARESKILILDEPDAALDARWRQVLWSFLRSRQTNGATVVLALHHFEEVLSDVSHWLGLEVGRLVFCESGSDCFPQAYVDRLFSQKSLTR